MNNMGHHLRLACANSASYQPNISEILLRSRSEWHYLSFLTSFNLLYIVTSALRSLITDFIFVPSLNYTFMFMFFPTFLGLSFLSFTVFLHIWFIFFYIFLLFIPPLLFISALTFIFFGLLALNSLKFFITWKHSSLFRAFLCFLCFCILRLFILHSFLSFHLFASTFLRLYFHSSCMFCRLAA